MTKTHLALILASLILTGCATQVKVANFGSTVEPKTILIPTEQIANVGEVMLEAREKLKENVNFETQFFNVKISSATSVQHRNKTFTFSIPSGEYYLHSRNNEGSYYAIGQPFTGLKGTRNGYGGLFVPNGSSEATEFYWNWMPQATYSHQAKLLTPIQGSISKKILPFNLNKDKKDQPMELYPRATLTYAGVANDQIRFVYKEFTENGLARPAFTQEVSLDYKPGSTYAYKSARFKVYKADLTHISFEIISPLSLY